MSGEVPGNIPDFGREGAAASWGGRAGCENGEGGSQWHSLYSWFWSLFQDDNASGYRDMVLRIKHRTELVFS
jgi:hypothetical protein